MKACNLCSRRDFLKFSGNILIALTALGLAQPLLLSCSSQSSSSVTTTDDSSVTFENNILTITSDSSTYDDIYTDNNLVTINSVDGQTVNIIILNENNTISAYSSVCPHAAVNSQWSYLSASNKIRCGAHNSQFEVDGTFDADSSSTSNVGNLTSYSVIENNDSIQIVTT